MKKSKIILIGIIVVVVVVLAVWAGILIAGMRTGAANPDAASPYSAVYLSTGDIYFGRLSWFPSPHMTDAWYITRNQGANGQTQVGLASMASVFWGPVDSVNFNASDIVFWTRLKNGSQVVQAMENPSLLQNMQNGASAPNAMPPAPAPSSTPGNGK